MECLHLVENYNSADDARRSEMGRKRSSEKAHGLDVILHEVEELWE